MHATALVRRSDRASRAQQAPRRASGRARTENHELLVEFGEHFHVALVAVQLRAEAFGESGPAASAVGHAQGRETATHQVLQPVRTKLEELRAPITVLVRAHPARARS